MMTDKERDESGYQDEPYSLQQHDGVIVKSFCGDIQFTHDLENLRLTFETWFSEFIEEIFPLPTAASFLAELNPVKIETKQKATEEELKEIARGSREQMAKRLTNEALALWEQQLEEHLEEAVTELLHLIYLRVTLNIPKGKENRIRDAAYFNNFLESFKEKIKQRFEVGGRGGRAPKLSTKKRANLYRRYQEIYSECRNIKRRHDKDFTEFKNNHSKKGFNLEQWRVSWLKYASEFYPDIGATFLLLFTSEDKYVSSASAIAYRRLASETGHGVEYLKKLVRQAARQTDIESQE